LPLWATGCALYLLRLAAARWVLRCTGRRCETATGLLAAAFAAAVRESGVRQRVRLLLDQRCTIPVVWGIFRPRLLLPAEALVWETSQLRSVLLHELAHIRRRDPLAQVVTQVACAIYWFHPLVWVAARRLHVERERACDDLVLAGGVRPSEYAGLLLRMASLHAARWSASGGLAMARRSSLEGRLHAVLSDKLDRRGLTRMFTATAILVSAALAVPVAMLRAQAEKPPGQPAGNAAETGVTRLDANTEAQLDWGEAVNGLRGAVVVRVPGSVAQPALYLAVQNVSTGAIRLSDTIASEKLRTLYVRAGGKTLFALTSGEPTLTDELLQPREVAFLRVMPPAQEAEGKSPEAAMIEGLRKDSLQTWKVILDIAEAPAGAWKGKLTTAETRGAVSAEGPQPENEEARALFKLWQSHARLNGDIPGGLLDGLQEKVKVFIRNNTGDSSGDPYARKMAPLEARFELAGDWKPADVVLLLDDIAAVTAIPLETTMGHLSQHTLRHGRLLPAALENADWGDPLPGGLRMAFVLEPRSEEYHLGTEVKARILLHNAGKEPVAFLTSSFQQPGHKAKRSDGRELALVSTEWTTLGRPEAYRLEPGELIEVRTPGLGIGPRSEDRDDWSDVRAGSWIRCEAGDEVTLLPGAAMLSRREGVEGDESWWLEFISERIRREAPVPLDPREREYLLYRVVRDLFGTAPSVDEGNAFAADTSPDALRNLAVLLSKREYITPCHGLIHGGETTFRVLPPDPDAAERPRVAMNPGRYTLGDLVRLVITRPPDGERVVNKGSLIYYPPGRDNIIHDLELPDGHGTWAAGWVKDTTFLWVSQKGLLRSLDFADPASVRETRYEGDRTASAPIPAGVREALRAALVIPDGPRQVQEPLRPAATAPGVRATPARK